MIEMRFDWDRAARTGVSEAVLADGKSLPQLEDLLGQARERGRSVLLTRLSPDIAAALQANASDDFHYDAGSRCAVLDMGLPKPSPCAGLIVTAGSSDLPVAWEAQRTLAFHGFDVPLVADCGVAGLWRLIEQRETLAAANVLIAVAGMEGALFSVLAGLTPAAIIAVPTSVGYGVAAGGQVALNSALATCSPGVVTVNIDNGFGAACAMLKILAAQR